MELDAAKMVGAGLAVIGLGGVGVLQEGFVSGNRFLELLELVEGKCDPVLRVRRRYELVSALELLEGRLGAPRIDGLGGQRHPVAGPCTRSPAGSESSPTV